MTLTEKHLEHIDDLPGALQEQADDDEVDDEAALAPAKTTAPSIVDDDEADIIEPVAVPKKTVVKTVSKVVKAIKK